MSEIILTGQKKTCPELLSEVLRLSKEALTPNSYQASKPSIESLPCTALGILKKNYETILDERKNASKRSSPAFPKYPFQSTNHKTTLKDLEGMPW